MINNILKEAKWIKHSQDEEKFEAAEDLEAQLPKMRKQIRKDLNSDDDKTKILALMISLIDRAYFRIGNDASVKEYNTRGLSTLQKRHIRFEKDKTHFVYTGKDGVDQHKIVADRKLTNLLKELVKKKGPQTYIFTYRDKGRDKRLRKKDANEYLQDHLGTDFSVRQFRTYHATRMAKEGLEKIKHKTEEGILNNYKKVLDEVAQKMGHTNSNTAPKHYIDAHVLIDFFKKHKIEPPKLVKNLL